MNDFRQVGYRGPAPPKGQGRHRYYFRLYALDEPTPAGPGLTKERLYKAMEGHVVARGELVGVYER